MRRNAIFLVATLTILSLACDSQVAAPGDDLVVDESGGLTTAAKNGPPMTATMQVGRNDLGTDFFPPGSHDASIHAKDAFQPKTVVISSGGTVTFNQAVFHTVAIYEAGTTPEDINTDLVDTNGPVPGFPPIIDSPTGRIERSAVAFPEPKVVTYTFENPGVYLVICEVLPHFVDAKMYAYVRVK